MNCEDLNRSIFELADCKPMEASVRDASLSHISICSRCATKLANARAVNNGLVLAASLDHEEAPPEIKANLLAAFAETQQGQPATAEVVEISSSRRFRWWTAAAAVAAAILLAVILPNWKQTPRPEAPSSGSQAGVINPSPVPPVVDHQPLRQLIDKRVPKRNLSPRQSAIRNSNLRTNNKYETVARNDSEYLPLTYMAKETAVDSGVIVRVELSRSALASLGLPVTLDGNSTSSVKAEVVIGDDGVARAIRLLQ
ncbi:MAG TPA: hypothetical protein VJU86_10650 [Pyrinomonadaceae bacterium]|nr:hypothetical protein [Pyrinomonadaceae bacterium]